jgi:hypothetical protein
MAEYTIYATDEQNQALIWLATSADPPVTTQEYLQARNTEILDDYLKQYSIANASSPPVDVAVAYAGAPTAQQVQVDAILGMPASKKA